MAERAWPEKKEGMRFSDYTENQAVSYFGMGIFSGSHNSALLMDALPQLLHLYRSLFTLF
jgi:hypothetical protein